VGGEKRTHLGAESWWRRGGGYKTDQVADGRRGWGVIKRRRRSEGTNVLRFLRKEIVTRQDSEVVRKGETQIKGVCVSTKRSTLGL